MTSHRVLCVDDEEGMREVCEDSLSRLEGVRVDTEGDPARALLRIKENDYDLVVTDMRMPGMLGTELMRLAREVDPELPFVVMTAFPTLETAVQALKLGAVDYVAKPFHPDELNATVARLLENRRLKLENRLLRTRAGEIARRPDWIAESPAMRAADQLIERVAQSDVDVLIVGETGTGKEVAARLIHERSRRSRGRFVPVNCGAIPRELMEAEFFGYERGAFTGAASRNIGLMEYASGGTIFLDEVTELPAPMQAKLLRALQERTIRRLGGREEIAVDVRVIAAAQQDLRVAVAAGTFREDLYYRIQVVTVSLPRLAERGDDIERIARAEVERLAAEMGSPVRGISQAAIAALMAYPWPGNVRELINVLRRAIALAGSDTLQVTDLPEHVIAAGRAPKAPAPSDAGSLDYASALAAAVQAFDREFWTRLLREHAGDVSAVAAAAGVPRASLYRIFRRAGIRPAQFRRPA